jgi:hypothetical protein
MTAFRMLSSMIPHHHCRCDSNGPANANSIACRLRVVVSRRTGIHERVFRHQGRRSERGLLRSFSRFARIYPVYFLLLSIAVCLRHEFRQ